MSNVRRNLREGTRNYLFGIGNRYSGNLWNLVVREIIPDAESENETFSLWDTIHKGQYLFEFGFVVYLTWDIRGKSRIKLYLIERVEGLTLSHRIDEGRIGNSVDPREILSLCFTLKGVNTSEGFHIDVRNDILSLDIIKDSMIDESVYLGVWSVVEIAKGSEITWSDFLYGVDKHKRDLWERSIV
jgi:hypothetical protein